jgi:hypothetical protein
MVLKLEKQREMTARIQSANEVDIDNSQKVHAMYSMHTMTMEEQKEKTLK